MTTTFAGTAPGVRRDALAGARAMVPWLVGIAPFGLVIGVSAAAAEFPAFAGWLTGPLIYSGSAQLATIDLLNAGAAAAVVVLSALIINLRLILYAGVMAMWWRERPRWWRALAAALLVDPSFAVGIERYERPGDRRGADAHYLGGALALAATWLTAIAVGVVLGARLPSALQLEYMIPLFLVGRIAPKLRDRAVRRAVLTAAVVAVVALTAPLHLGLLAAIVAGLAAGLTEKETRR